MAIQRTIERIEDDPADTEAHVKLVNALVQACMAFAKVYELHEIEDKLTKGAQELRQGVRHVA